MDKPFDGWGKLLWTLVGLEGLGAQPEVELAAERLALDLQLTPTGPLTAEARHILGEAARLASSPACIELYSTRPKKTALLRSLRKYLLVRETQPDAALWLVFSERSAALLRYLQAIPLREAPPGFYDLGSQGVQRLLVVPELPTTPETLFLRLLGRGELLRNALHEALTLPVEHPLGRSIAAHIGPFQSTFVGLGLLPYEDTMRLSELFTPDIIEAYNARMERERQAIRQRAVEEGLSAGRQEGRREGRQEGELLVLGRLCQRTLKRPLSELERDGLAQRLRVEGLEATTDAVTTCSAEELKRWLREAPPAP